MVAEEKKYFYHEGHEVHEGIEDAKASKKIIEKINPCVYFVSFVLFVVKSF